MEDFPGSRKCDAKHWAFDSRNLIEAATTVIEAISNPFDVMQGNSFGGHVPACKCHKLSNAITNQARQ